MTLILNQANWEELWQQAPQPRSNNLVLDDFEELLGVPEYIGRGYSCSMELLPGVWLSFLDWESHQDWMLSVPVHDHLIQILVFLSGFIYFDRVYPNLGGSCGYLSGSGISPAYVEQHRVGQRLIGINVEIEPELLNQFFFKEEQLCSGIRAPLFKKDDWKVSFYPTVSPVMRSLVQQLWNVPYRGAAKRMYLQGKVLELLAMQLNLISTDRGKQPDRQLKPTTIDCIYYARDLLLANLEHPPSVSELARQVGISDCTLQRRFQELFGMTVFGYLTNQRMELAEQLLRQGNCTIVEIATMVGYSNPGHFAAAFKRKFGILPSECVLGKKPVLRSSKPVLE